jgi:RNA polymerase sigma-70 factor, ECF subfamily
MRDQFTDLIDREGVTADYGMSAPGAARWLFARGDSVPARYKLMRVGAGPAVVPGEVTDVLQLTDGNVVAHSKTMRRDEAPERPDVLGWSDSQLIAAVRRDPPDQVALDTLVDRYWKPLFGRCQMLTLNHQRAGDLAQEAWCRVLRARHSLKPDGNFPAYLTTVATNLWRDSNRSARRAGPMAEHRLASLDAALSNDEGESVALVDVLPDLNALQADEQRLLAMDIDRALEALSPLSRDVLVARYLVGESCAEIGRRYGRTEQTISGWVREALRQVKSHLKEPEFSGTGKQDK